MKNDRLELELAWALMDEVLFCIRGGHETSDISIQVLLKAIDKFKFDGKAIDEIITYANSQGIVGEQ